jgi:superfamily II RNA helicase
MNNDLIKDDKFLTVFDCPYDESIHGVFEEEFEKQHFKTKYPWDSFQLHAFQAIKREENVLTVAPTSSGKTSVAKYAMLRNLLTKEDKRVVYTTPTKSLSNEKFGEMKEVLAPYGIVPGLLTGDQKINVDSRFLIMTAEILCNALFMLKRKDDARDEVKKMIDSSNDQFDLSLRNQYELDTMFVNSIGCVVIDEIHYMSDRSRGGVWETTLVLLNPSVQIIGLSATISDPELFASLLGKIKQKKITLVKKYDRPVPLEYAIYNGSRLVTILDAEGNYQSEAFRDAIRDLKTDEKKYEKNNNKIQSMLNGFVRYAKEKDLLQLCFIVFSKKNCEKFADHISVSLINGKESADAVRELERKMGIHLKSYENMPRYRQIKGMIEKGVCFHHAGIPVIMKEVVEHLFKTNHIKVLFATETIAIGVNMPIRTLVLSSVEKSVDSQMQTLNAAEFNQICGRAGRRGLDCKGLIVFLPLYDQMSEPQIRNELLFGPLPKIESRMELTYHSYLKLSQSSAINKEDFYESSLLSVKNNNMTMGLCVEINKIKDQLDQSKKEIKEYIDLNRIDPNVLQDIKEYIKLTSNESKQQLFDKSFIQIKPNKQQLKHQKKLETVSKTHKNLYELVIKNNKIEK